MRRGIKRWYESGQRNEVIGSFFPLPPLPSPRSFLRSPAEKPQVRCLPVRDNYGHYIFRIISNYRYRYIPLTWLRFPFFFYFFSFHPPQGNSSMIKKIEWYFYRSFPILFHTCLYFIPELSSCICFNLYIINQRVCRDYAINVERSKFIYFLFEGTTMVVYGI